MDLEKIIAVKKKYENAILIIQDGNKVSTGWGAAIRFAAATGCSLGTIQSNYDGEKIPWVVRRDINELLHFFETYDKDIVIVNGVGTVLSSRQRTSSSKGVDKNKYKSMLKEANALKNGCQNDIMKAFKLFSKVLEDNPRPEIAEYIVPQVVICLIKLGWIVKANNYYCDSIKKYGNGIENADSIVAISYWFLKNKNRDLANKFFNRAKQIGRIKNRKNYYIVEKALNAAYENADKEAKKNVKPKKTKKTKKKRTSNASSTDYLSKRAHTNYSKSESTNSSSPAIGQHYKKANKAIISDSKKGATDYAKLVEQRRSYIDSELYPYGVRYGDAYRFRRKKKR